MKERKNYWKSLEISNLEIQNLDFFCFVLIFFWKKAQRFTATSNIRIHSILFVLLFNIDSRSRDPYPEKVPKKVQEERAHPLAPTALFHGNSTAKNLTKFKKCVVREENHAEQLLRD